MIPFRFRLLRLLLAMVAGTFLAASAQASTINQTVNGGTLTLTGDTTRQGGSLAVDSATGLVKTGAGNLIIIGANTYNGTTTLTLGTNLVPLSGGSLGPNTALVEGGVYYPAGSNTTMAQVGAAHDFGKFRNDIIYFTTGSVINLTQTLALGSNRPVATPPAALASFATDNTAPTALITAADGTIYGVTEGGGTDDAGQIVRVEVTSHSATLTPVADFIAATLGSHPHGPLRFDAQGRIVGLTRTGAANGKGGIFRFDPATATLEILFAFPADLAGIANSLVLARDGNFYGTSSALAEAGEIHRPLVTSSVIYQAVNTPNAPQVNLGNNWTSPLTLINPDTSITRVSPVVTPNPGGSILGSYTGSLGNLTLNGGTLTVSGANPFTGSTLLPNGSTSGYLVLNPAAAPAEAAPPPQENAAASLVLSSASHLSPSTLTLNNTAQLLTSGALINNASLLTINNYTTLPTGTTPTGALIYPGGPIFLGSSVDVRVGSGLPQTGSIFRLSSTGDFTILKTFTDAESVQVNLAPGGLASFAAVRTVIAAGNSVTLHYSDHEVTLMGPGLMLTSSGSWQFTPDDPTLPVQSGTLPNAADQLKSARAYFPCNLGESPTGDLLSWVSGGLYRQPADGSAGEWLLPPGNVGGYSTNYLTTNYLTTNYLTTSGVLSPTPVFQEFGRVVGGTVGSGLEVVLRDEAPAMEMLPDGSLLIARDDREWQVTTTGYVDRTIAPSRTMKDEPLTLESRFDNHVYFTFLTRRKLRGPVFPTGDDRYRFEYAAPGGVGVTATENGRGRPLADLAELRCGTLLSTSDGAPDLLFVGRARGTGTTSALYRVGRGTNQPPVVTNFTLGPGAGSVNQTVTPLVRQYFVAPLYNAVDPNDDSFYLSAVTPGEHGTVDLLSASNSLIYTTPEPAGPDQFTFTISDALGASSVGQVTLTSAAPIAGADRAEPLGTDAEGRRLYRVRPLVNDTTPGNLQLGAFVAVDSSLGTVHAEGDAFLFTLSPLVHSLDYLLCNGDRLAIGHLLFGNNGPVARPANFLLNANLAVTIPFAQLATDPDGDSLNVSVVTPPAHGQVGFRGNALFYQGDADVIADEFTLSVDDGGGAAVVVIVHVARTDRDFAGTFSGAIKSNAEIVGQLRLAATGRGKASLQWQVGKEIFRGVATLPATGSVSTTLNGPRGGKLLVTLTRNGANVTATGTISGQTYDVSLTGSSPEPLAPAQYNVVLNGDPSVIAHLGFAIIRQRADGIATITGRTPDGLAWSAGGIFDANGDLPVFALLKLGANSLGGVLHRGDTGDISGNLLWSLDDLVSTDLGADGKLYTPPIAANGNLFGETSTSVGVTITANGLPEVASGFTIDGRNRIARQPGAIAGTQLLLTPSTGLFRGSVRIYGHTTTFTGVLRGNTPVGGGPLIQRRGSVTLAP